jgi:hypothetical protein
VVSFSLSLSLSVIYFYLLFFFFFFCSIVCRSRSISALPRWVFCASSLSSRSCFRYGLQGYHDALHKCLALYRLSAEAYPKHDMSLLEPRRMGGVFFLSSPRTTTTILAPPARRLLARCIPHEIFMFLSGMSVDT